MLAGFSSQRFGSGLSDEVHQLPADPTARHKLNSFLLGVAQWKKCPYVFCGIS